MVVEELQSEVSKTKKYTWSEIFKHDSAEDLWLVVKGKVYDVTSWVPNHPGGKLILSGGGREATALFLSYHPQKVEPLLKKYEIGEVEDYKPFYNWDQSEFYPTLKRRVESFIKENNLKRSSYFMYFKTIFILVSWLACMYYGMIQGYILGAFALGIIQSQFGINIAHDALHGAYSGNSFINRIAARSMDFIGASSLVWLHQHNIGHHPNANRQGDSCKSEADQPDPDASTGYPIIRLGPSMPLLWYHKWQHLYIWLLCAFVTTKWYFNDIRSLRRQRYVSVKFFRSNPKEFIVVGFTKVFFLCYLLVLPLFFHSVVRTLILFFIAMAVSSYIFVFMFSVNHLTDLSTFPDEKVVNRDWARLQVMTATNFAVGSKFWTAFSGGLNYQIEHHLFPYLCHVYLPLISPIVQQTCKEFGVPYLTFPSFWDALAGYITHLRNLGNPDQKKIN